MLVDCVSTPRAASGPRTGAASQAAAAGPRHDPRPPPGRVRSRRPGRTPVPRLALLLGLVAGVAVWCRGAGERPGEGAQLVAGAPRGEAGGYEEDGQALYHCTEAVYRAVQ
jgi:hypothetical protein